MASEKTFEFRPDYAIAPGATQEINTEGGYLAGSGLGMLMKLLFSDH
jgi:hypothetical protein